MHETQKLVIVLPGGNSPVHPKGMRRYGSLAAVCRERGLDLWILDYVGYGHYPVIGDGIDVEILSDLVASRISRINIPFTLFANCLGTLICGFIWAYHAHTLDCCERLVFWGGPSRRHLDDIASQYPDVTQFNEQIAHSSGFALGSRFWRHTQTLSDLAPRFLLPVESVLACGIGDEETDVDYLAQVKKAMPTASADRSTLATGPGEHDFAESENLNILMDCIA